MSRAVGFLWVDGVDDEVLLSIKDEFRAASGENHNQKRRGSVWLECRMKTRGTVSITNLAMQMALRHALRETLPNRTRDWLVDGPGLEEDWMGEWGPGGATTTSMGTGLPILATMVCCGLESSV